MSRPGLLALRLQVPVEPVREPADVPEHREPAVLLPGTDYQLHMPAGLASAGLKPFGLLQRGQCIGISVNDSFLMTPRKSVSAVLGWKKMS